MKQNDQNKQHDQLLQLINSMFDDFENLSPQQQQQILSKAIALLDNQSISLPDEIFSDPNDFKEEDEDLFDSF